MTTNYSSKGELLSATLPNGTTITYDQDPMGRRIAKSVNGTIIEKYLWKDAITLLAVYDASDNLIMRFNYADERMPVSMTYNGSTYYLAYDQVGSLKAVTDSSGNIVKKIDYDSFGSIISDTNPTMSAPFGFAGGINDRDTNLIRFGLRDYDPSIGKWTAKDPIDFFGGDTNLYGYVTNDPLTLIDPQGDDFFTATAAVIGAAAGLGAIAIGYANWFLDRLNPPKGKGICQPNQRPETVPRIGAMPPPVRVPPPPPRTPPIVQMPPSPGK